MPVRFLILVCACLFPRIATTQTIDCAQSTLSVTAADPTLAARICEVGERAIRDLAACNLPLDHRVTVHVVEALPEACVGQYHCGEDRIDLLAPSSLEQVRGGREAFASLPTMAYLDSILVHELAHAALKDLPCPFDSCVTTQEYVAYAMQVRSLPDQHRARVVSSDDLDQDVSRDAINPAILYMAPDIFAVRAYSHFTQRDDPCGYIGRIAEGRVLLDYEEP